MIIQKIIELNNEARKNKINNIWQDIIVNCQSKAKELKIDVNTLSDIEVINVFKKCSKRAKESEESFRKANRLQEAEKYVYIIEEYNKFIPELLSKEEIQKEIDKINQELNELDSKSEYKIVRELPLYIKKLKDIPNMNMKIAMELIKGIK